MRFKVLFLLFLTAVFSAPATKLLAQDLQARDLLGGAPAEKQQQPAIQEELQPKPQETEGQSAAPPETSPPVKEYPERYIAEMGGFYEYCLQDNYLSRNHDCDCLAGEYIDMRVQMGDQAGSADIIAAINHSCPSERSTNAGTPGSGAPRVDMAGLTDEQIEDIQQFYNGCTNSYKMRTTFDCDCLAAQYTEKRIEKGEYATRNEILLEISNTCPNVAESAGHIYNECMQFGAQEILTNKSDEEFCECVANQYGKIYGEVGGGGSSQNTVAIHSQARLLCMDLPGGISIQKTP